MNTTEKSSNGGLLARQPLSAVGKIAFRFLLVITIFSLLGIVALAFIHGLGPSNIAVSICAILGLLFMLSGVRLLQALSALVIGIFLVVTLTVPYVTSSLADPKSTQIAGGFGKFVGIVVLIALALMAFISCLAVTAQNYLQRDHHQTPRWFSILISGALGIMLGSILLGAVLQPAAGSTGTALTNGVPTVHMGSTSFDQNSVTISKGSSLLLVDDTSVVHILANGSWQNNSPAPKREASAPVINNVQLESNSVTVGPFTTAGTYHIYCIIHAGMQLTVIVQ